MIVQMEIETFLQNTTNEIGAFFAQPNAYRAVLILIVSIVLAYWLSNFLAKGIIFVAQQIAVRTDTETREERVVLLRQVETYLSVAVAAVRAFVVAIVAYITWKILTPTDNTANSNSAAAIGASAFFIVFAGATLGIVLRDLTAGAIMIAEKWFTIGDFIKVEPFIDMSGVVERMTLRSTKLRSLSGEIIWIHNQQIQAVHVTPNALRVMAVDVFVKDPEAAQKEIEIIMKAVPTGPTLLARPLRMKKAERWGEGLWRITIVGETAPGRDWLIEKYFVNAIMALDADRKKSEKLFVYEPIARFADPIARKKFKRAVRVQRDK
jgi:small-conductance mechanosensitive channel